MVVLLHLRVPGGSGGVLFAPFFQDLSREGVRRGIFGDFLEFGGNLGSRWGPFGLHFRSFFRVSELIEFWVDFGQGSASVLRPL